MQVHALPNDFDAVDRDIATVLFDRLREAAFDGVGITRPSFSARETQAMQLVADMAEELGFAVEWDAGSNLVVTLAGADPDLPYIACGSHLDSVPQGGNFDGAAGVIAGLLCIARLKREGFRPKQSIKVFALRGEESARFGRAYMGSAALLGRLSQSDLALKAADDGTALIDCMRGVGVDVNRVVKGEPLFDLSQMAAWIELHIEQGPVLIARQLPIGIVTGIRGNIRHRVVQCVGEAGHSGAVPRWLRHDAVFATAELIAHLDRHWRTMLERGRDLVITAGVLGTDPTEHAIARIPGLVRFSFEVRSQSDETMASFYDLFLSECSLIEEERGVKFSLDRRLETSPATMATEWIARLKRAALSLGLPAEEIPSGAGHDSALFADAGIPSAMVFVRNANGSHNPEEAMQMDDFMAGVNVIRAALVEATQ